MQSHEVAIELATQWTNGNRDHVMQKLGELHGIQAAAVAVRMVLQLHDGHEVSTDLALFTTRLEGDAFAIRPVLRR